MSFNRQPKLPNPRSPFLITAVIVAIALVGLVSLSGFYADWLWFNSVDFTTVWKTVLSTKALLFVSFGLVTSLLILLNVNIAFRRRPLYAPMNIEADNLERYRAQVEPVRKFVFAGLALVLFYFSGSAGSQLWSSWLMFRNSTPFGVKDPQFGLDISFFAFKLPFYQSLLEWAISTVIISLIASIIVHYLYGGIRLQVREDRTTVTGNYRSS
jgi:uncharacterized protein